MSGVGEVISWLDWWLSTLSKFGESLPEKARSNFQRLMVSGAKTLEFLGSQTTPVLANLVLLRRDSLLSDVRSTVPAEELSRLHHAPLPPSSALFPRHSRTQPSVRHAPRPMTLHPPRIPKRQPQGQNGRHLRQPRRRIGPGSRPSFPVNGRLRMRSLQWHLKSHWSPERDPPNLPVPQSQQVEEDLSWWMVRDHLLEVTPFGMPTPDLRLYSDASRAGWGAHFLDQSVSGVRSHQESALYINLLEMKALFLAGTVSDSLCSLTGQLRWTESNRVQLEARYLPGQSNVLADLLSCRNQVLGVEWSLHPQVARDLLRMWGSPTLDLFTTHLNAKLPLYCSLIPDPQAVFEDAFRHPWDNLDTYVFSPFHLVERVVARVRETPNLSMTLVAPLWPEKAWFTELLPLLTQPPLALPLWDRLLRQPHFHWFNGGVHTLSLHEWRLSSVSSESQAFREELRSRCPAVSESPLHAYTSRNGSLSVVGVVEGRCSNRRHYTSDRGLFHSLAERQGIFLIGS